MIIVTDIITVAKKEIKEIVYAKNIWQTYGIIFLWALFFAYLTKDNGMMGMLMFGFLIAFTLASTISRDLLMGERERNTLESLLTTRLPGYSIILGKIMAAFIISYTITLISLVAEILIFEIIFNSVVTINPIIISIFFALPAVIIFYVCSSGSLVSIMVSDNRSASLILIAFTMVPIIIGKMVIRKYHIPLDMAFILNTTGIIIIISSLIVVTSLLLFERVRLSR
ncbi:MAG: ABC transporter permease subunit [Bacteroides sp.]|nr:ABC transporter permease subunit [Bacteroides sp.]MDD4055165.1 ABC transporter permease subunit [Bacteroides sp.]MDD4720865.1 ABC transporter permease subunit [Bacteroides sp.]